MERWTSIPDYHGFYEVSDQGNIRGVDRTVYCPLGGTRSLSAKALKAKKCSKGKYLQVALCKKGTIKYFLTHRLVLSSFAPTNDPLLEVNHKDGNTHNNTLDNLEWCTRSFNIQHSYDSNLRKGTVLTRAQCHLSKLTANQVNDVIRMRSKGIKYKDIAKHFNMSISGLEKIIQKSKNG